MSIPEPPKAPTPSPTSYPNCGFDLLSNDSQWSELEVQPLVVEFVLLANLSAFLGEILCQFSRQISPEKGSRLLAVKDQSQKALSFHSTPYLTREMRSQHQRFN